MQRISRDHRIKICPTRPNRRKERVNRRSADPGLNPKPAARDDSAQNRRNIRALRPETCAAQYGKRNAVFRAGVRVQDHRNKDDAIAQKNRQHRLPPLHSRFDKPARKGIGRDHDAHPDPERGNVPR